MTAARPRPSSAAKEKAPKKQAAEPVGYGRPPRQHQFKPGQSGNPRGRPRGRKNEATILDELLHRQIEVREKNRVRRITVLEGMLLKFAEDALKGNPKAAAFLLTRYGLPGETHEADAAELTNDEQEILDAYARRLEAKLKGRKS
jgi:hypothetical protein